MNSLVKVLKTFLRELAATEPSIDLVIDDGGHTMVQQVNTFDVLYSHVKAGGVYVVEDVHTSYWPDFQEQAETGPVSFIELAKVLIDKLNAQSYGADASFAIATDCLHFYKSMCIIEKADRDEGTDVHPQEFYLGTDWIPYG